MKDKAELQEKCLIQSWKTYARRVLPAKDLSFILPNLVIHTPLAESTARKIMPMFLVLSSLACLLEQCCHNSLPNEQTGDKEVHSYKFEPQSSDAACGSIV